METLVDAPHEGTEPIEAKTVICFTGSEVCLDQETVESIRHQILELAESPGAQHLVLDFGNVAYLGSLALGTLVTLHKRLAEVGRRLTLCNPHPWVREVLATTRLDRLLHVRACDWMADPGLARSSNRSPLGVLVVDDDDEARQGLGTALRARGIRTWLAYSGHQAVELYRTNRRQIGLVLLEAWMRGMDGPDTLSAMRRLSGAIRCCFTIGCSAAAADPALLRLGAVRVFRKPLAVADVVETVDQLVRRSSQRGGVRWIEIPKRGV